MSTKQQELSFNFLRLQGYHDITTYEYLQNLVIYLSAFSYIQERVRLGATREVLPFLFNPNYTLKLINIRCSKGFYAFTL